jgi:predicted acylesterase/phospholipase RssA
MLFGAATPVGFPSTIRYLSSDRGALEARRPKNLQRLKMASKDGAINILALSGGGAAGAFGAGALVGLTRRGERPPYQLVTGVSSGALIAPFAFLGSDWDAQLIDAFSGAHSQGLLRSRGLAILFHPGIYRSAPLVALVDRFLTKELMEAVAREYATGRMLMVATTDLDKEETVMWDMGAIAAQGGEAARTLFRNVLVASASIPGLFPPVIIHVEDKGIAYDEMHADGGTTVPFFLGSELAFFSSFDPGELAGWNIYVVVNGQLGKAPRTTAIKTVPILARSFSAGLTHMSREALTATSMFAQRNHMNLKFTEIPLDYPRVGSLDFRASSMRSLFDYGAACARNGLLWVTVDEAIDRFEKAASARLDSPAAAHSGKFPGCPLGESTLAPANSAPSS